MPVLIEGELELHYPSGTNIYRIENHTPSHCMNAVDFVLNLHDKIYFLEIKDYRNYSGTQKELKEELTTYRIDENYTDENCRTISVIYQLVHKCRDSFIYEYSHDRIKKYKRKYKNKDKEIIYIVFILFPGQLDSKNAKWLSRNINNHLGIRIPIEDTKFRKPFIKDKLVIVDTDGFNNYFQTRYNIQMHLTN